MRCIRLLSVVASTAALALAQAAPAATTAWSASPRLTGEAVCPLTGLPAEEPSAVERPVVALKIDNAPAARPHAGLQEADVVFTELVEGGITRFVALYHCGDPEVAGPVRSGREVDAKLLPPFRPLLGMSGAASAVREDFREVGLATIEEGQGDPLVFFRSDERRAPHNLYARPAVLKDVATSLGVPAASVPWPTAQEAPSGGMRAESVQVRFSGAASAQWTWDAMRRVWLREQDGAPHLAASGEQLAVDNVVLAAVDIKPGDRRDSSGAPTVDITVIGKGDAIVLRDGRAYAARWIKTSPWSQLRWRRGGRPFPLAPGQTWIELVPTGALTEGQEAKASSVVQWVGTARAGTTISPVVDEAP